jgi:hypothetical protein
VNVRIQNTKVIRPTERERCVVIRAEALWHNVFNPDQLETGSFCNEGARFWQVQRDNDLQWQQGRQLSQLQQQWMQ